MTSGVKSTKRVARRRRRRRQRSRISNKRETESLWRDDFGAGFSFISFWLLSCWRGNGWLCLHAGICWITLLALKFSRKICWWLITTVFTEWWISSGSPTLHSKTDTHILHPTCYNFVRQCRVRTSYFRAFKIRVREKKNNNYYWASISLMKELLPSSGHSR